MSSINPENWNALIIIADQYPKIVENDVKPIQDLISAFIQYDKPVYCEFIPLLNICSRKIINPEFSRFIVRDIDNPLLHDVSAFSLLESHQIYMLLLNFPISPTIKEILCFGRVAGVDKAIFGIPKKTYPGLIQDGKLIFATTKLSDFDRMEFRPKYLWAILWGNILEFLCFDWYDFASIRQKMKNPFDNSNFMDTKEIILDETILLGMQWFENSGVFAGFNAKNGVYEGFSSGFDSNGRKTLKNNEFNPTALAQRGDCTLDTLWCYELAKEFASSNAKFCDSYPSWAEIATNLQNQMISYWHHYDESIYRGLFGWYNDNYHRYVSYSDDNGRNTLELLMIALFYEYRENRNIDKNINHSICVENSSNLINRAYSSVLALYLTLGKNGHRFTRIDPKDFFKHKGRRWFQKHKTARKEYKSPHYDAWTLAAILYGAYWVKDQSLVELAQRGIEDYMEKFPKVPVEHSINDDFSKLLVACACLFQNTQKPRHLTYLKILIEFFANIQDPNTGAIPEQDPFNMHSRNEKSNERYGTIEAAIYVKNTDTITDQLYSSAFIAWGLYFSWKTGQCPEAKPILEKILAYLCKIQLKSPNPQLNGGWMRGFDFHIGEPFGANGDVGWGAYSMETGWMIAPNLSILMMYALDYNPFHTLSPDLYDQIQKIYSNEKRIQDYVELNWRINTPNPPKKNKPQ